MNCLHPNNAPRTGYNKGCRCARCKAAMKEKYQRRRKANLEYQRKYRKANKDAIFESNREYYKANKDALLEYQREYRKDNKDKRREYYEAHKENFYAYNAKRRAAKLGLTLGCPSRLAEIETEFRKAMPEGHHLDHIQPISKGGVHHPCNWASCPAEENISKGNRSYELTENAISFNKLMDGVYVHTSYHINKQVSIDTHGWE